MANRSAGLKLDAKDLKILELVQNNGRISKKALAQAIGLSLTPCFQRLRRLEKSGFISSYRGVVDAERFGSFVWAHTEVTLARHRAADFTKFETAVRQCPEILECDAVSGGIDYVLKVITRDVGSYQRLIEGLLDRDLGMHTYFTYIVTKRVKQTSAIPLARLIDLPEAGKE
jgi:Lrp/AsnC family transcriptional regulator of ectoine degradation